MKPDHIPSQKLTDETLCRLAASGDRVAEGRLGQGHNPKRGATGLTAWCGWAHAPIFWRAATVRI